LIDLCSSGTPLTLNQPSLDLGIFWVGLKKNSVISGRKNPAHDHPTGRVGPQFSGRARAKKNFRRLQDFCPRPSSKFRGRAWRGPGQRAGSGRAQNAQV
jgi:hypothetical protein